MKHTHTVKVITVHWSLISEKALLKLLFPRLCRLFLLMLVILMVMTISMEQCWDGSDSEEPKCRWWVENLNCCPVSTTVSNGLYGD